MKPKRHRNLLFIASIGFFTLKFTAASAFGADRVWTGLGGDDNWSTASNWSGGVLPVPDTDSLTFSGTTRQSNNADLPFAYYLGITFSNGGFTISGPSNPGLRGDISSVGDNSINTYMYIAGGATRFINNSSGTLTLPAMDLQGATVQDNSSGTTVFGGTITNIGLLRVFSTGQTVLGGDNSAYPGNIDVYRFAKLTHANGLGGASTTVTLDRSYDYAYIDLNGLDVSGVNLSFTAAENPASTTVARLLNTNAAAASFGGNIALNYGGYFDCSGNVTLSGNISGAGELSKFGGGTLTLSGNNSYTGITSVANGILVITGDHTAATGSVFVNNGGSIAGTGPLGGNLTIQPGGRQSFAVAATSGVQVARTIPGLLTLDAGHVLDLVAATTPANGTYVLATASGGIVGSIGTVILTGLAGTVAISGNSLILTVGGSPYSTWANTFLPGNDVSNPAGDNDQDGLTNQQEFAFGLSPISGSSVNPILVQLNKTTGQFSYQRRASSGLTYKILTSTSLTAGSWTHDVGATQVTGATDGNGNQIVVVTLTGPLPASKLFVRVAAE